MTIVGVVILSVLLVIAGLTLRQRNKDQLRAESAQEHKAMQAHHTDADKRARKAQRSQSRNARRKRH